MISIVRASPQVLSTQIRRLFRTGARLVEKGVDSRESNLTRQRLELWQDIIPRHKQYIYSYILNTSLAWMPAMRRRTFMFLSMCGQTLCQLHWCAEVLGSVLMT